MTKKANKATWKRRFSRALVALIALLVLNSSVDTAYDPVAMKWNGEDYTEDVSFNDIESIYELITECWLDMDDFVPEQDDEDGCELAKTFKDWLAQSAVLYLPLHNTFNRFCVPLTISIYLSVFGEVNIPPPDQLS